jgi:hypothetical protein
MAWCAANGQRLDDDDGDADAPDGVQAQDEQRPRCGHAEGGNVAVVQQAQPLVVRVEQGQRPEAFLDHPGGEGEGDDGGPAVPGAPGGLADEQRTAAVEQRRGNEQEDPEGRGDRDVAEQDLGYQR